MHGVRRVRYSAEALEAKKQREQEKLKDYLILEQDVLSRRAQKDYSSQAFTLTSNLLTVNPEYYTIWNYRRLILLNGIFPSLDTAERKKELLEADLELTLAALKKHPKVYWIWNHRTWCLENMPNESDWLQVAWDRELKFVERMLDVDARNFHAWEYRRLVFESHPSPPPVANEIQYTNRKIASSFSNFSAWHQRSKVLPILWDSGELEESKSRQDDFDLLRNAMYTDPNDQSVWMYHRWLMGSDPSPELLEREIDLIQELLNEEPNCKWCIESIFSYKKMLLRHNPPEALKSECLALLDRLKEIDPLRMGRYNDLAAELH